MAGDGTPEFKEMMKLHTQFSILSPFFHTIITGFDLALEEKMVSTLKTLTDQDRSALWDSILDHWYQLLWVHRSNFGCCRKPSR